ncbi:MAG: hypothetical protein P8L41_09715 [Paracoccaceae bacterium]|nr:hypothetical protein [Paracoccaceae bacterium]
MRIILLLFLMTLASISSAEEIGPCPDSDSGLECMAEEAIKQALGELDEAIPNSPPLTMNEVEVLVAQVKKCLKPATKYSASIVVNIKMNNDGTVKRDSVRLLGSFEEKDKLLINKVFDEAKFALFKCENDGYNLPLEKYEHWKEIEIHFDF